MLAYKWVNIFAVATLISFLVADINGSVPWYFYLILGIVWFFTTAFGSWFIRWNYHVKSLHAHPNTSEDHVAITFDDGPHPEFTKQVLEVLKKYNARATFFLIGKNCKSNPDLVQQIIDEGHTIANHTFSHAKNIGFFSTEKITAELQKTNELLQQQTGLQLKLFRPAFGVTNPKIARALKRLKLQSIGWNQRSYDTTKLNEDQVYERVTKTLKKGDVILLHDTSAKSVAVLERLLLFLKSKSMQSVTVDQLLQIQPYA